MNGSKWLAGELPKLREAGILDEASVKKLRERYPIETPRENSLYFLWMMSIAGAALICAGIALFANFNWGNFDKFQKLGIAALPLVGGFALGIVAVVAKGHALSECAALVNALGTLLLYKVFAVIYQFDPPVGDFAQPVLVAWLLLIYIFNSAALALLFSAGLFVLQGDPIQKFVLAAAIMPFVLYHLRRNDKMCVAMRYTSLIVGVFGAISFAGYYPPLYLFTLLVLVVFGGWEIFENGARHFANPWLLLPFGGFVALLAVAASDSGFYSVAIPTGHSDFNAMRTAYWLATSGLLAILAVVFPRRHWDAKRIIPVVMTLGMIYPLKNGANVIWTRIFISVCGVLLGLALVSNGVRRLSMMLFNAGLLVLAVMISCHFFNDAIHIYFRAGGLIVFGAAFIVANAVFSWHIRRREKAMQSKKQESPESEGETK